MYYSAWDEASQRVCCYKTILINDLSWRRIRTNGTVQIRKIFWLSITRRLLDWTYSNKLIEHSGLKLKFIIRLSLEPNNCCSRMRLFVSTMKNGRIVPITAVWNMWWCRERGEGWKSDKKISIIVETVRKHDANGGGSDVKGILKNWMYLRKNRHVF